MKLSPWTSVVLNSYSLWHLLTCPLYSLHIFTYNSIFMWWPGDVIDNLARHLWLSINQISITQKLSEPICYQNYCSRLPWMYIIICIYNANEDSLIPMKAMASDTVYLYVHCVAILSSEKLAPVPLSIFRSNSKFDENSERSSFKYIWPITAIFCTRHDSDTVVTCAKYCCDQPLIFYTRVFWIFIKFRIRSKYA